MDLITSIYEVTRGFPQDERFGLTNQVRRAAVSIASNIAEGQGRGEGQDFQRFLRVARGSTQEVETQIIIAVKLGYLSEEKATEVFQLSDEVGRLINGLLRSLSQAPTSN
jgi:four helix bundle protein